MPKQQPTDKQIESFGWLIDDYRFDELQGKMIDDGDSEYDGILEIFAISDGAHFHAYMDGTGTIVAGHLG